MSKHKTDQISEEILTNSINKYWDSHTLGKQYIKNKNLKQGTKEFFDHIKPWMNPYKFPEIMPRIEKLSLELKGKNLLEVGCGMGFDSIEFLKRGVRVTLTDLTKTAVELARLNLQINKLIPENIRIENALNLSFQDNKFDAVWACGVIHHTGNTEKAIMEIHRVLKPGGLAIICHIYRKPSWMYFLHKYGGENIEFEEEDPPITEFLTEHDILPMFNSFEVREIYRDHYRALPIARTGMKAHAYKLLFRPIYNTLPRFVAERLAYKFSIVAVKPKD